MSVMKIRTELKLFCTVDDAWAALDDPTVFQKVSKPFLSFTPISPPTFPDRYRSGESYQVEAKALGLFSLGRQEINPVMTENGLERTFVDNGRGLSGSLGVVKHFHHTMTLRPSGQGPTLLADELEWDAGILSPLFFVGFRFFWWWRHKIMAELVPSWRNVDTAAWEARYASAGMWSGRVNPTLEKIVSILPATGSALDVGAGEGADALWLSEQGFDVTALDASPTALARGEKERVRRITADHIPRVVKWIASTVVTGSLPERPDGYQLVTSQFLHIEKAQRKILWKKLAAATAAGGTLIIIGHSGDDQASGVRRPPPELIFDEKELRAAIPASWSNVVVSEIQRTQVLANGESVPVKDIALVATR